MNKGLLAIGFIGGILAAVGVFLDWFSEGGMSFSGWDLPDLASVLDLSADGAYVYVVLIGGVLALIGALVAFGHITAGYLLPLGGIIALIGWIWAAIDVSDWSVVTYGFYACLVGAILALVGSAGLRGE